MPTASITTMWLATVNWNLQYTTGWGEKPQLIRSLQNTVPLFTKRQPPHYSTHLFLTCLLARLFSDNYAKTCAHQKKKASLYCPWSVRSMLNLTYFVIRRNFTRLTVARFAYTESHLPDPYSGNLSKWLFLIFYYLNYQLRGAWQEHESMALFSFREMTVRK